MTVGRRTAVRGFGWRASGYRGERESPRGRGLEEVEVGLGEVAEAAVKDSALLAGAWRARDAAFVLAEAHRMVAVLDGPGPRFQASSCSGYNAVRGRRRCHTSETGFAALEGGMEFATRSGEDHNQTTNL